MRVRGRRVAAKGTALSAHSTHRKPDGTPCMQRSVGRRLAAVVDVVAAEEDGTALKAMGSGYAFPKGQQVTY